MLISKAASGISVEGGVWIWASPRCSKCSWLWCCPGPVFLPTNPPPICSALSARIRVLARHLHSWYIRSVFRMSSLLYLSVQPPNSTPSTNQTARVSRWSTVSDVKFVDLISQADILAVTLHFHQRKTEKSVCSNGLEFYLIFNWNSQKLTQQKSCNIINEPLLKTLQCHLLDTSISYMFFNVQHCTKFSNK